LKRVVTGPFGHLIVVISSRGIDIIEIQGLLGSTLTSNISFECGRTGAVVVWAR
jgi:hypothetical protein